MKNDDYREVPLTLVVSLTLWVGAVAAGTSAGVFQRLPHGAWVGCTGSALLRMNACKRQADANCQ